MYIHVLIFFFIYPLLILLPLLHCNQTAFNSMLIYKYELSFLSNKTENIAD